MVASAPRTDPLHGSHQGPDIFPPSGPNTQKFICEDIAIGKLLGLFSKAELNIFPLVSKTARTHKTGMNVHGEINEREAKREGRRGGDQKQKSEANGGAWEDRGPLTSNPASLARRIKPV